ncbi:phosphoenolpyruvate--protein phosphotransferase [Paenibacillus donghaensis]|uniref:phosphoenolpyruvate--protein phosphotransferase n=1 Tax=Paenibacillus donghaensis TaxID=414771 RepID=UPI0018844490|nr:phosphoenolpyruvate--protein phosphotransferase [Paenibacillus donghaensis]MBE9914392.1 phosphoenolpyruvate--protein phosphotransferase [Paenibacillus donghaensis]
MQANEVQGIAASPGIAIAKAYVMQEKTFEVTRKQDISAEQEMMRLREAIQQSRAELEQIFHNALEEFGEDQAGIFEGHLFVLQDPEWLRSIEEKIAEESVNAEFALDQVTKELIQLFRSMKNAYMRERSIDIQDVSRRVMGHLLGASGQVDSPLEEPVIVIAHDLTPSDTAGLDVKYVVGIAADIGGRTSHSAIMARSMGIPAVVGLQNITERINGQTMVIIDGMDGKVIVNPSPEQLAHYEEKRDIYRDKQEGLTKLINEPTIMADGRRVELAANIGTPDDVEGAIRNGAEGIGLFRSEFLYMNRESMPDEEEQFQAYRKVAEGMDGKPVIIRTLDIGGDKELPYLQLPKEQNPFLGYRAIRLCLDRQEMFKTQLRAILRASRYGLVKIMYPMIAALEEFRQANQILAEAKEELIRENIAFHPDIEVGIMIEIPAAALAADALAKEADFFSIGTNDLIQYTMACDRMNEKISYLYQPFHPAVLRLIRMVIDAAHKKGKWVGMCGEMAADKMAVPVLMGLGLDEISMGASSILPVRQLIRQLNYGQMKELADKALELESSEQIRQLIQDEVAVIRGTDG